MKLIHPRGINNGVGTQSRMKGVQKIGQGGSVKKTSMTVTVTVFLLVVFLSQKAVAEDFKAECMTPKGKFKTCTVEVAADKLAVKFKDKKYKDEDMEVSAAMIERIVVGGDTEEGSTTFLSPGTLIGFNFGGAKKSTVNIEYKGKDEKTNNLLFKVKAKQSYAVGTSLKNLTGKDAIYR